MEGGRTSGKIDMAQYCPTVRDDRQSHHVHDTIGIDIQLLGHVVLVVRKEEGGRTNEQSRRRRVTCSAAVVLFS
jgi:hypothetical protein